MNRSIETTEDYKQRYSDLPVFKGVWVNDKCLIFDEYFGDEPFVNVEHKTTQVNFLTNDNPDFVELQRVNKLLKQMRAK